LIAIGSGQVFGKGLGQSIQKYKFLPESISDTIFAVLAEEGGFVWCVFIIIVFFNKNSLRSVMFGHAGDGNVHIDVLKDDIPYDVWKKMLPDIKGTIYRRALDFGGTITGEHGIGCLRKDYLSLALSSDEIDLSRRIKAAFDPGMILNPGKIFS
jgi:glycolate oxidase